MAKAPQAVVACAMILVGLVVAYYRDKITRLEGCMGHEYFPSLPADLPCPAKR
ncbi:MAG TPA: hypothetical protein VFB38_16160 [Chthonomonadaceae bacterium]|nr:hypothetical protein [Chthonomonadaceae bacterium]